MSIAQPPSTIDRRPIGSSGISRSRSPWSVVALGTYIVVQVDGLAAVSRFGFSLLTLRTWDSNRELFGLLPAIWGTVYSSMIGLAIGTFFGLSIAIVLSQDFAVGGRNVLKNLIELLAAIPSVVYGLWGIFVVVPAIKPFADW